MEDFYDIDNPGFSVLYSPKDPSTEKKQSSVFVKSPIPMSGSTALKSYHHETHVSQTNLQIRPLSPTNLKLHHYGT